MWIIHINYGNLFYFITMEVTIVLLGICVVLFLLILLWWYKEYYKSNKYLAKYPSPLTLPIIGNAYLVKSLVDIFPVNRKLQKQFGGIFKVSILNQPRLIVADSKLVESIMTSSSMIRKSYEYRFMEDWLGTGLLTSYGMKWRQHRKLITSAFHFQILEQFMDTFNTQTNILIEKLRKHSDAFDICHYTTLCTLDIICEAAMGTQVNAQNDSESEYVYSVKEMCRIIIYRGVSPLKMLDFFFPLSKDYHKQQKALGILHGYTNMVIKKRRQELIDRVTVDNTDDVGIKKKMAFLDLLLQSNIDGKPLSDEVIREEVDTFMFEGHDTTASGISFTLYCLSKYPEIQNKVVDELRSIFGNDKNRPCTYQDLQEMKYTEMVIKESMRIYPPVPYFSRVLEEDTEFNEGNLPKGTIISVSIYGLHRLEEVFPDPEKFDPNRFLTENILGRSPYAYVPFSGGFRNCIGQRFALMEMKVTIANILRNFELLPVYEHSPILTFRLILKSDNGLLIRIRDRNF